MSHNLVCKSMFAYGIPICIQAYSRDKSVNTQQRHIHVLHFNLVFGHIAVCHYVTMYLKCIYYSIIFIFHHVFGNFHRSTSVFSHFVNTEKKITSFVMRMHSTTKKKNAKLFNFFFFSSSFGILRVEEIFSKRWMYRTCTSTYVHKYRWKQRNLSAIRLSQQNKLNASDVRL